MSAQPAPRRRVPDADEELVALDQWLADCDAARPYSQQESLERLREAFRPAGGPDPLDPVLQPHLVAGLWRWSRAVLAVLGRLDEDEMLEAATADAEPDPWRVGCRPRPTPVQRALLRQRAAGPVYEAARAWGLPLLPPRDPGPAADWCAAFEEVASDLRLARAPRGPDVLAVLCEPGLASLCAVAPEQVLAYEEVLVDAAQRLLVRHGERAVVDVLADRYGLSRREGLAACRLARADALLHGRSSVEEDRALMVAQLKNYLARARQSLNMGDEIRALKQLAHVQGLTRTEPEDAAAEFLGVVRRVAGRRDASDRLLSEAADAAAPPDPEPAPADPPPAWAEHEERG